MDMWSLCIVCILLSPVSGVNQGAITRTEKYARPGSDVLLSLRYNLTKDNNDGHKKTGCDQFAWKYRGSSSQEVRITGSKRCEITKSNPTQISYNISEAGHLTLLNVTRNNSGNYSVTVHSSAGDPLFTHNYALHVLAPVSKPLLNVSCLFDGGADISCEADTADDPRFTIIVNEYTLLENSTSSRIVGNASVVNGSAASPGPWNITCSVTNWVSDSKTRATVTCPVPLSEPILGGSCLPNGSLEISCSVENGTDPTFSLTVNGTSCSSNVRKKMKSVNATLSSPGPWNVNCSVNNSLGKEDTEMIYPTCPVPPSYPILKLSCHNGSLIISCSVEEGTDPIFNLSVNDFIVFNDSKVKMVHFTSTSPGPWNVFCYVRNHLGAKNKTDYKTCPESSTTSTTDACLTCLQNSIIGGVVALIVTTSPFFIASFYIDRREKK